MTNVTLLASLLLTGSHVSPEPAVPLKLHVRLSIPTFSLEFGSAIQIGYENTGTEPIYVYDNSCLYNWKLAVEDDNGVRRDMNMAELPPLEEPDEWEVDDLVMIPPEVGRVAVLGLIRGRQFAERPGRYKLHLTCSSPVDWEEFRGVRVWSSKDGPLNAVFEFEMTE